MLLKHRPPGIDATAPQLAPGFEHLDRRSIAVLRWLNANKVDYVVVGPVAFAIRGDTAAAGPVAIVPAPYGRNYDRLARALIAEHAGLRSERGLPGAADRSGVVAVKLTADKLARGRRWMLRFGEYDLDLEAAGSRGGGARGAAGSDVAESGDATGPRAPRYQELLYESNRFEPAAGLAVEVAAPEDLEHFSHVRRTGVAPEFRVTRNVVASPGGETEAEGLGTPPAGPTEPT
ncbi:MAG: hypothetical protein WAL63_07580 [Solirubrobacteraceae bacterium]